MDAQNNCPKCGLPLETNALQGLCPECLIKAGWPTVDQPESDAEKGGFVPPAIEDLAGLFPQLEILELIGRGGMGAVYKARQPNLDRIVALKILAAKANSEPGFTERFTREARALAKLSHPSIVAVYDFGHAGDLSYFIMEHVDGPNLREIERAGQLTPAEALDIIPQICEALQFAHDAGVVHRDIKPENILLDQTGHVKIADFGLAKIMGQERSNFTLTEPNHVMGTPHYMAPEQVEHPRDVDHRADIYSLGVVFYEMLTGELPLGKFKRPSRKVQMDVRLDEVVLRTLEKEPELRYQQASQVRTEVQTIASTPHTQMGAEASGRGPKTSRCYISTSDYLKTFRGRFFNIYQGKGELSLSPELLSFKSGWQAVTIPLKSIKTLAQGTFPTSAKPLPLHFMAVTFDEHGVSRTLLFMPVRTEVMSPSEANRIGAQWLSDLIEAIRLRTGQTLPVGYLDVTQETSMWEYVKLFLFMTVCSTIGFSVIPIMLKRRLPNSLNELLPGILFAIPMFFMCLTMPRWLGRLRDRVERRPSRTENGSKPESRTNSSDFGRILKWFSVMVLIIILLLAVSLIVPELQQRYMNSRLRFGPVVERKFYHSDADKAEIVFWDLDRDVIMTPGFSVALPEGTQLFKWLSPASLQNNAQLNQWIKDCGIDLALTFSKRQDSSSWSWYVMGLGAERLNSRFEEHSFDRFKTYDLIERETCALRVGGNRIQPGRQKALCIKTDRGKAGVLEYDGLFNGVTDGFKIRYKLLERRVKRQRNSAEGDVSGEVPAAHGDDQSFIQSLPKGTLELVAVSHEPDRGASWWKPDGSPWTQGAFQVSPRERYNQRLRNAQETDDRSTYLLVLRGQGLPAEAYWSKSRVRAGSGIMYYHVIGPDGHEDPNLRVLEVSVPKQVETIDVEIGVAFGPWVKKAVYEPSQSGEQNIFLGEGISLTLGPCSKANVLGSQHYDRGKAWIKVTHGALNHQIRAIAHALDGEVHDRFTLTVYPQGSITQLVYPFWSLENSRVKQFELQVRPYEWAEFREVSLVPGQKTSALIQDAASASVSSRRVGHPNTSAALRQPVDDMPAETKPENLLAEDNPFVAEFSPGRIELVAISGDPCEGDRWWKPDGSPWIGPGFINAEPGTIPHHKDALTRMFVFRGTDLADHSSWPRWDVPNSSGGTSDHVIGPNGQVDPNLKLLSIAFGQDLLETNLRIGVADGSWQTVAVNPRDGSEATGGVAFAPAFEREGEVVMSVSHSFNDREVRIVAVDVNGVEHQSGKYTGTSEGVSQTTTRFRHLRLAHVHRFEFRTRPYTWVTFKGVALQSTESRLAFRLVPKNADNEGPLTAEEETALRRVFREQGPAPGGTVSDYVWIPFQGETPPNTGVIESHRGQVHILASNRGTETMLPDGSWGLEKTGVTTNPQNQPVVTVRFDGPGSDRFYALTSANRDRSLGIIIDGRMVSAPTIHSAIAQQMIIDGDYTRDEAEALALALRGMPPVSIASTWDTTRRVTRPAQVNAQPPVNTSNMPPEAQAVYQVLKDWYRAGTFDDAEKRVQYLTPDQSLETSLRWIEQLNRIIPNRSGAEPVPRAIHWDDREALFISDKLELPEAQSDEPMVLLCLLTMKGSDTWRIEDFDLEGTTELQLEISRFTRNHPDAEVWVGERHEP